MEQGNKQQQRPPSRALNRAFSWRSLFFASISFGRMHFWALPPHPQVLLLLSTLVVATAAAALDAQPLPLHISLPAAASCRLLGQTLNSKLTCSHSHEAQAAPCPSSVTTVAWCIPRPLPPLNVNPKPLTCNTNPKPLTCNINPKPLTCNINPKPPTCNSMCEASPPPPLPSTIRTSGAVRRSRSRGRGRGRGRALC